MPEKNEIVRLLERGDFAGLKSAGSEGRGIFRVLLSMTYDKESLICWRAIDAIGLVAADYVRSSPETVRGLVQKLLWMMRDESGNNAGSAPEILGEIIRNCPDEFSDIAHIIASFHEEEMLRRGVLRALVRIGEIRPDLCISSSALAGLYIENHDTEVRAYAVVLAGILGLKGFLPLIESYLTDKSMIRLYKDGEFHSVSLGNIAEEIVTTLRMEKPIYRDRKAEALKRPSSDDVILRCPFCGGDVAEPVEIITRFGNSFTGGQCPCGAVYVFDRSGHNLGDAYVDALAYACDWDWDKAWNMDPDRDYDVKEVNYDSRRKKFIPSSKAAVATFLFILVKKPAGKNLKN